MKDCLKEINKLKKIIKESDGIVIGAGAGLSTSAGFVYEGERFEKYFFDFIDKYNYQDMYSGGFYVMDEMPEVSWAYWSRYIYINRYMNPPKPVYDNLYNLIKNKDYFVITTNVDYCFQKAGFEKKRLFYTQGDYGLFQCNVPCHNKTYDNKEIVEKMLLSQGFKFDEKNNLIVSNNIKTQISKDLIPYCPICGKPMSMNLRADNTFVQDDGWHNSAERYTEFLRRHENTNILFLELGVGMNTPGIIKYSFWRLVMRNPRATYACVNYTEVSAPKDIADRSITITADAGEVTKALLG